MRHADVLIVGAGMGGLVTANRAQERGLSTLLLEADQRPGGSMRFSGGLVWTANDLEVARQVAPQGDENLQRVLVDGIESLWSYLQHCNVPLLEAENVFDIGRGRQFGLGAPGFRDEVATTLLRRFVARGGDFIGASRVRSLDFEPDVGQFIAGVHHAWQGPSSVGGERLVLASGGFHADKELVERHIVRPHRNLVQRGNAHSRGDGLVFGLGLGGLETTRMDTFYGHSLASPIDYRSPHRWIDCAQYYTDRCVLVAWDGRRFVDESAGVVEETVAQAGARLPDGRYAAIFDDDLYREHVVSQGNLPGSVGRHDAFSLARDLGASTACEDTLDKLCARLTEWGIDGARAAETVADFNAWVRDGARPGELSPERRRWARAVVTAPFRAVALVPAITFTTGGLAVDDRFRLRQQTATDTNDGGLRGDVRVVGADAGGVFGHNYAGGLAWAGVGAMRAIDDITSAG